MNYNTFILYLLIPWRHRSARKCLDTLEILPALAPDQDGLPNDSFTLPGTATGTGKWWVSMLHYVLYTLHRDRDRDRDKEPLGFIPISPFPFPVPGSVNEPLVILMPFSRYYLAGKVTWSALFSRPWIVSKATTASKDRHLQGPTKTLYPRHLQCLRDNPRSCRNNQ